MSLILNIESSSKICSVALSLNGTLLYLKETDDKEFLHSKLLTVFIEDVFSKTGYKTTDLKAVAVSKGPGSYTGLRIGVSTAKGIAYSLGIPVISVETLQAMSSEISQKYKEENTLYCPMLDARRMEVYCAIYNNENNLVKKISADIINKDSFSEYLSGNKIYFFGDGASKCKEIIKHNNAVFLENINPSSKNMINFSYKSFTNSNFEDIAYFEPFYLKDFIATVPKNKF